MRIASSVTSISWIPSEAVEGVLKMPFKAKVAHYDAPPPEVIDDLIALRDADRFRFANRLEGWIEVDGGKVTGFGQGGTGYIGSTTVKLGVAMTFQAVSYPDLRPEPEVGDGWVRFTQTSGGRTGAPAPRRVSKPPYVQIAAPTAWTTLSLTLHADGRIERELAGASPFPRHWLYDDDGKLVAKSGLIDFKTWAKDAFGKYSPWGDEDSLALMAEVESSLERQLSALIMSGEKPRFRKLAEGDTLVEQGDDGRDLFLLLDGVLEVSANGEVLAQLGPGAVLGERAILEGGQRTATLRALTKCRVAVATADQIDPTALAELREQHRREDAGTE